MREGPSVQATSFGRTLRLRRLIVVAISLQVIMGGLTAALPGAAAASSGGRAAAAADTDGDGLRDRFEIDKSHTNPHRADTDADGTPDGAEDPDRDALANVWEQRLKLNPLKRDTDGDGVRDGNEDADHDNLRNHFEIHGGVTDPRTDDTDHDGVRDSAEDPDGDLLSNLGEQRWNTNPSMRDTDGDHVPDGKEDANHNGRSNAAEQDVRPVPRRLVPSLADAFDDKPQTYADGCHVALGEPYRTCTYGPANAKVRVALFGDSHASAWFPALLAAATARGWQLSTFTRGACPPADVRTVRQGALDTECLDFRRHAIHDLNANPPTLVLLNAYWNYAIVDADNQPVRPKQYERTWDEALARTLQSLPKGTVRLVLEDTPYQSSGDVPACLKANRTSLAACEGSRASSINVTHAQGERATAEANSAVYGSLTDDVVHTIRVPWCSTTSSRTGTRIT